MGFIFARRRSLRYPILAGNSDFRGPALKEAEAGRLRPHIPGGGKVQTRDQNDKICRNLSMTFIYVVSYQSLYVLAPRGGGKKLFFIFELRDRRFGGGAGGASGRDV
jgi:hypothetical protein